MTWTHAMVSDGPNRLLRPTMIARRRCLLRVTAAVGDRARQRSTPQVCVWVTACILGQPDKYTDRWRCAAGRNIISVDELSGASLALNYGINVTEVWFWCWFGQHEGRYHVTNAVIALCLWEWPSRYVIWEHC